jgi:hypothetical protein
MQEVSSHVRFLTRLLFDERRQPTPGPGSSSTLGDSGHTTDALTVCSGEPTCA